MTICIASICAGGKAIVAASDRMVTAEFLAMEFEHPGSKIEKLDGTCVGLTAGDALAATELFAAAPKRGDCWLSPDEEDPENDAEAQTEGDEVNFWTVEVVAESIATTYARVRNRKAEERYLRPRGLTLDSFYSGGVITHLPESLAVMLDSQIQQSGLGVEAMVAGIDDSGAHIYAVTEPGAVTCMDRLGYHAIGSGLLHALLALVGTEHRLTNTLNETVFQVYEAKRRAEVAQGVGHATEIVIVTADGVRFLSEKDQKELDGIYVRKTAPKTRAIRSAVENLPYGN